MSDDRSSSAETEVATDEDPNDPTEARRGLSNQAAFWTGAVLALVISIASVWLIGVRAIHFEALNRVRPTVEGGGVGSGWIQGNTEPALDWLITLVHFADVIMGVGILVMLFIHWIAFRRLAARMRPPNAPRQSREAVATDGGSEARPTEAPRDRERAEPASGATGGEAE